MTIERFVIVGLLGMLVWFGAAIIRLENYHYAAQIGFCSEFANPVMVIERDRCLEAVETRTHPLWHLAYGLKIL